MLCGCGLMVGGGAGRDECDSLGPACHIPYLLCVVKMFVHFVFGVQQFIRKELSRQSYLIGKEF